MNKKCCRGEYEAPKVLVTELTCVSVLCASGEDKSWYQRGGVGDFTYSIDEDDTWE